MRLSTLFIVLVGLSAPAIAQSDIDFILQPEKSYTQTLIRVDVTPFATADEEDSDEDFEMTESILTLRYNLIHSKTRDLYFTLDTYAASIDNNAAFKESGADLPEDLYSVSAGVLFREELDNGWTLGGTFRLGSSSDKLFNTSDEVYMRSQIFLRVPHLEYTSWVFIASIDTDADFPLYPGVAYAFPISRKAYMMIGIPVFAAGGQFKENINFSALFLPSYSNIRLDYRLNDRVTPYVGYTARSRNFARAKRDDEDDRIRLYDSRVFGGTTVQVCERGLLDVKAGYSFDREFGEGDDRDERNDNTIEIDNAAFASIGFQLNL